MSTNACVVERPSIAPSCCLSNLSLKNSRIQPPTTNSVTTGVTEAGDSYYYTGSNTFDSIEVKYIGRRSDSIFLGELVLEIGTKLAFFYMIGTIPSRTDAVNMAHTGSASQTELSRRIQFGILSGPHDLLVLVLLNLRSKVYGSMMNSSGQ